MGFLFSKGILVDFEFQGVEAKLYRAAHSPDAQTDLLNQRRPCSLFALKDVV